ncbi:MAG TPA: acyl-CoA thioesterase [Chitinophagaceae bacterium]
MRWIRLLLAMFYARFRSRLNVTDSSVITFRVWLTDIDISIMNHAALLTVMEMGRVDFMVRSGFLALAKKKKWYFPSAAISAQFVRPLKLFQKASVITRVFHVDERWIYIEQKVVRNAKEMAVCIVKSKVKKGRETIDTSEILRELQLGSLPSEGREVVDAYERENMLVTERLISTSP